MLKGAAGSFVVILSSASGVTSSFADVAYLEKRLRFAPGGVFLFRCHWKYINTLSTEMQESVENLAKIHITICYISL